MRRQLVVLSIVVIASVTVAVAGPQARVIGTVVDTSGQPIASAVITITSDDLPSYTKEVQVDDKGAFKVLLLDATKTYLFAVAADGYIGINETIKVAAGSTKNERTFELKSLEEAHQEQRQEIREQPGYKQMTSALAALKAGDTTTARSELEAAIAAAPDLSQAWEALAELEYREGNGDVAMERAKGCLDLDDEAVGCLAIAANVARDRGDDAEADAYMARYRELNPDDPASFYNEAVQYINALDDEATRPLLEKCLEVDPDYAKCLYEYGMLQLRTGDMEGAKKSFEHYLEVAPDGDDAATVRETVKYL